MCQNPLSIRDKFNAMTTVQCRKCQACIGARKRHWIGRMLAEETTATAVWFTTFTYAGGYDNVDAYVINYADLQKTFKRLRKAGYKFKYVAVGEHGTAKERAHFHVAFYWQGTPPEITMDTNAQWQFWDHGHVNAQFPRSQQACASYIMDYMNKDNLERAVMKYSKNPMLGENYLLEYARRHARAGLALFAQSDRFTIPNNLNRNGDPFYYPVGRQTGMYDRMLKAYLNEWALHRPNQRLSLSEDVTEYLSEISQNPDLCSPLVRDYLERVYDVQTIEGDTLAKFKYRENDLLKPERQVAKHTVYSLDNLSLMIYANYVLAEIYNNHGETIWRGHVTNERIETPQTVCEETKLLKRLRLETLDASPPRTHRFLLENPNENSLTTSM